MPFLTLVSGESVGFEVLSEEPEIWYQHWFHNMAFACEGENCPFCARKVRRSTRFVLKVRTKDGDYDWGLSKRVFTQLTFLSGIRKTFKGMVVQLTRIGTGTDTQYRLVELTEETPPPPPTRQQEAEAEKVEMPPRVEELIEEVRKLQEAQRLLGEEPARWMGIEIAKKKDAIQGLLEGDTDVFEEIEF